METEAVKFILFERVKPRFKKSIFIIFGILFTGYFIIISLSWGRVDDFNKIMIGIGFLFTLSINKGISLLKKIPRFFKGLLKWCFMGLVLSFILVEGVIIHAMKTKSMPGADYVIILGCQVDGSVPSLPLLRRVQAAVPYLKENKNTKVIVAGGMGPGETISEAEAMKHILIRNGIDRDRIFEENRSKSTLENFRFSHELYDLQDKNIVVVSSDYHIFRALAIAKKLNYQNVTGLPSRSRLSALPVYLLREYMAVVYYVFLKRI